MTRIEHAKKGLLTDEIKAVAAAESLSPEKLASDIAEGFSVITRNMLHSIAPLGIGRGMSTKINANIGTSKDRVSYDEEIQKLEVLIRHGADAVMDLSTGGAIKDLRNMLIKRSTVA
ncbi:MAG: phosphomethylpyrimidine synthase ThiC, partial [Dissulfurispiraceae bacterium]